MERMAWSTGALRWFAGPMVVLALGVPSRGLALQDVVDTQAAQPEPQQQDPAVVDLLETGADELRSDVTTPPPAPAAPREVKRNWWRPLLGVGAMAGVQACLFPAVTLLLTVPAYALGAMLMIPAGGLAYGVGDVVYGNTPSASMIMSGVQAGAIAAAMTALPVYGPMLQLMCLGPAACLTLPALALLSIPFTAGVAGAAGRAVTHKNGWLDVMKAGLRVMLLTGVVAWPAGVLVLALTAVGGLVWGGGSAYFIGGYAAGDAHSEESARQRNEELARFGRVAEKFFLAGSAVAALGAGVALVGGLILLPHVLWPVLDYLGDGQGIRD